MTSPDFWPACGFRHLNRDTRGWLQPTPAYLQGWLQRPELALVAESCRAEIRLHEALKADPQRAVPQAELAALEDADARENYAHFLALRDGLLQAGTLQGWLLALWRGGNIGTPPLFIDLVVQAVVRGLLEGDDNAFHARAGELLFRPQRLSTVEGRLLAGDRDTLDLQRETHGFGDLGRLLAQAQVPAKAVQLQVLSADNPTDPSPGTQAAFWREAESPHGQHRFLLDLTHQVQQELAHGLHVSLPLRDSGLKALATVLERWVQHLLGVEVRIAPRSKIEDAQWRWHVGLDAQASALLNDLYEGHTVEPERQQRLISLFQLEFAQAHDMRADVAGKPVYLGLAMTPEQTLRLKPQNLLLNLPLAHGH